MKIWAIADLHLSFGDPSKSMDVFGPAWKGHAERIGVAWRDTIGNDDLVLLPGDISWAMKLADAEKDLAWIEALPGTKVMIRGNHDYWWTSKNKVRKALPENMHIIHNDALTLNGVTIGGARLWDTPAYGFRDYIEFKENPTGKKKEKVEETPEAQQRIFNRELGRLDLSLKGLDANADLRIAMTHYPPLDADLNPSEASQILEANKIDICLFGHLHNVRPGTLPMGTARGVRYELVACDYLDCKPLLIAEM